MVIVDIVVHTEGVGDGGDRDVDDQDKIRIENDNYVDSSLERPLTTTTTPNHSQTTTTNGNPTGPTTTSYPAGPSKNKKSPNNVF